MPLVQRSAVLPTKAGHLEVSLIRWSCTLRFVARCLVCIQHQKPRHIRHGDPYVARTLLPRKADLACCAPKDHSCRPVASSRLRLQVGRPMQRTRYHPPSLQVRHPPPRSSRADAVGAGVRVCPLLRPRASHAVACSPSWDEAYQSAAVDEIFVLIGEVGDLSRGKALRYKAALMAGLFLGYS